MANFYETYIKLCKDKGITPTAAAVEMGFSKVAPNGWKNGKMPRDSSMLIIAEYFGVSVEHLSGEKEKAPAQMGEDLTDLQKEVIGLVKQLPENELALLASTLRIVVGKA